MVQQPPQAQPQPLIIPIIIGNDNKPEVGQPKTLPTQVNQNALLSNPNQLRDMISQVISSQLQLHNMRKSHKGGVKIDDEDEYADDFEDGGAEGADQRTSQQLN